jgi:signal transduction histidine kinase
MGLVDAFTGSLSAASPGSPAVGAVGVVTSAALLSRRRLQPQLVLGVYAVWTVLLLIAPGRVPSLFYGTFVPLVLATYSAGRHGTGRTPWIAGLACAVTLAAAGLSLDALGWYAVVFNGAVCAGALATGRGLRRSEERAVAEALRAARLEAESRIAARIAVDEERNRIARDLHDVLGRSVTAMVIQAGAAEQVVGEDPQAVRRALLDIRSTGSWALDEVRRVVALLRDPAEGVELRPVERMGGPA